MLILSLSFWLAALIVAYAFVLYPVVLALLAKFQRPRPAPLTRYVGGVSVVIAAFNEEDAIGRRIEEFLQRFADFGLAGEVIVVSDGSTDGTAAVARGYASDAVRVLELPRNEGKAAALRLGCAAARHDVLVMADTRQTWHPDALPRLVAHFADPAIGAVSGDLELECAPGVLNGVGFYWRYEKRVRVLESTLHSTVGVTGAIAAVRRELFPDIPTGTILDDVYWPLCVALRGYRVVHDTKAVAVDRLPEKARDEFRRKVRTLSGNYQLAARLPAALLPWRNPIWAQFVSHKLLRLAVPWALLTMLVAAALLPGIVHELLFLGQLGAYCLGLIGFLPAVSRRSRVLSSAASFLVLNAAAWVAFWVWVTGGTTRSWGKAAYQPHPSHADVPLAATGCPAARGRSEVQEAVR